MNKQLLPLVSALMIFSAASIAQVPSYVEVSPDIGPSLQVALPGAGDYDLYDSGYIAELQFRDWINHPWGYLLAIGYGEWESDSGASDPGANLYDFDGELEMVPFGASILLQVYSTDKLSVTVEGGFRYIIADSKITARNSDHPASNRYGVDIDDSTLIRAGVGADYSLNEDFMVSFGVAYQKDADRGDLSTELGPGRDNILESFIIEAALRMPL